MSRQLKLVFHFIFIRLPHVAMLENRFSLFYSLPLRSTEHITSETGVDVFLNLRVV